MSKTRLFTMMAAVALLAGCSGAGRPLLYPVPVVTPSEKVRISYGSVEVRVVSLPEYAALSEMAFQTADGGIETSKSLLWADNPVRAMTLELSRALGQITGATVASEPWPFDSVADARVEVRIEEMLTDQSGQYRLSGQYFVGPTNGEGRMRARVFSLLVPLAVDATPVALAAARGQVIADLAVLIARDGLR